MDTYSYKYIYHNYNVFEKDGKAIMYGQAVLAKRDGTPFIAKITNKDSEHWAFVGLLKLDLKANDYVEVHVRYNRFGKLEYVDHEIIHPYSDAAYDADGLPI
jgi:hypothetical protein